MQSVYSVLLFAVLALLPAVVAADSSSNPIHAYVHAPDDAYRWEILSQRKHDTHTSIVARLVSQRWLTSEQVDKPEWEHVLSVVIPNDVQSEVGLLWIGAGSNKDAVPDEAGANMVRVALATGTVAAEVGMVPNQPLTFHGDGVPRIEDDLIAYGWNQYLEGGSSLWLARNAMVKSAVRAMDAVSEIAAEAKVKVSKYVVTGASKRGWTTWLTGAMDERVVGIAPIVIDVANVNASMLHHFEAYGFWAVAIGDYVDHKIMQRFNDDRLAQMYDLVDPLNYLNALHMPKYVLNAAGDQFFLPDSSQFYWSRLRGESYLRYIANTDHGMGGSDALESLVAFHALVSQGRKPPQINWSVTEDSLLVMVDQVPAEAKLWRAHNPKARDFRLEMIGPAYSATTLTPGPDGLYRAELAEPEGGWAAYFAEFSFDVGLAVPFKVTTPIEVRPEVLPFAGKAPDKPASVTLICTPPVGAVANTRSAAAAVLAEQGMASGELRSEYKGDDLYLNWTPNGRLYTGFAELRRALNVAECERLRVQLESGPDITLPPAAGR